MLGVINYYIIGGHCTPVTGLLKGILIVHHCVSH